MQRGVPRRRGGISFVFAILLGLVGLVHSARAAEITWDRIGPFQGCLAADLDKWLEVQVDALTNENPASPRVDDAGVFLWTVDVVASCKAKAGGGDEATEANFRRYMAQWRQHVHELVENVRQQGKPD
jgi:hypothetical protein